MGKDVSSVTNQTGNKHDMTVPWKGHRWTEAPKYARTTKTSYHKLDGFSNKKKKNSKFWRPEAQDQGVSRTVF